MASPLFPRFNRASKQNSALEAFRRTPLGREVGRLSQRYGGNVPDDVLRRTVQNHGNAAVEEVSRYGVRSFFQTLAKRIGPIGSVFEALLRPRGKAVGSPEQELEAAKQLLEAFGYRVQPPERVNERPGKPPRPENRIKPGQPRVPSDDDLEPLGERDRTDRSRTVEAEPVVERPLIEGMIPVTSSNVHSIGYEWHSTKAKTGNLLVRFLGGKSNHRTGPGSLYRYKDVPYGVFIAFKMASSKGKFVWDDLRIRGTVSGHQYDYELAGTGPNDYIPRQAGLKRGGQGEWYLQRAFQGRRSALPERPVRRGGGTELPAWQKRNLLKMRAGRRS